MGLRYRDELLAKGDGGRPADSKQHRAWQRSSRRWRSDTDSRSDKSAVLMDLLKIMGTLPVNAICQYRLSPGRNPTECAAVNTLPCLTKIRYVASELLTELESPSLVLDPISGAVSPENGHNRAIEYLCELRADLRRTPLNLISQIHIFIVRDRESLRTRRGVSLSLESTPQSDGVGKKGTALNTCIHTRRRTCP
jgi:hypothetical protein